MQQMELNELLCATVKTDQCGIAETLIKAGADVNYVDKTGKFPLYYAYEDEKIEQMKILLAHGADVNKIYDETLLHHECYTIKSDKEIIKMLIDNGADPNIKSVNGKSYCITALVLGNEIECMTTLLSYPRTNINLQANGGKTAFRLACDDGYGELMMMLLDKQADPNIQDNDGCTALMGSIMKSRDVIASILISQKTVKLDLQDIDGCTALHHACKEDKGSIVHELLTHGADQTIKDKNGKTAYECCTSDEIRWLLTNYEKINKTDNSEKSNVVVKVPAPIQNKVFFRVHSYGTNVIKQGIAGKYYKKWDDIFKCWSGRIIIPYDAGTVKCEYTNEKMNYHVIYDDDGDEKIRVQFELINCEDRSIRTDLYHE